MVRIGEDVSERLDIVPAEFFVQRHVRGKWACKCCQCWCRSRSSRRSSTRACRPRACWPTRWSAASSTTCRTTGKSRSTPAPACTRRARRWRPGRAPQARACSRCTTRTARSCWARRCCTPTRRRSGCSIPVRARPPRPTSGRTREASTTPTPGVIYDFCAGRGAKYPMAFLERMGRHAYVRRLQGLRRGVPARRPHRGRLPGARAPQVRRTGQGQREPGGRRRPSSASPGCTGSSRTREP